MLLTVILVVVLGAASIQALPLVYTLEPTPSDLWDLPHNRAFAWGFDLKPTSKYEIIEATLTFHNVYNWREEPNWLFIHLLDNAAVGVQPYVDDDAMADDYFAGQGVHLTTWSDVPGGGPGQDLTFTFSELGWLGYLNDAAFDGNAGFGFDPDCHFYNEGITLTVAQAVPEPASLALFALGLVGAGLARRRKRS